MALKGGNIVLRVDPQAGPAKEHAVHPPDDPAPRPAQAPSDPFTARDLLALVEVDREQALNDLVQRYRQEIFDLCARVSGSRSEAEDLAQETFIRAYENLGGYRGDAAPRSWLYRIAINRSITFTRRLKRWRMKRGGEDELFPELPELASESAERVTENRDLAKRAHRVLQDVSDRQRTAVILRVVRDLPYEEVAQIMGISVGAAKANVHHGLKKVREALGEDV
ncbi:RNA polymerase sigma factor [bacterium]|nr:RNA polymerase sigma factor [bacterium]